VSKKLDRPISDNWIYYQRAQPTTSSQQVPENTAPPIHFDNKKSENDMNDLFDENQLLRFVPKRFKEKAKIILSVFEERPNEITWDSSGVIYIDQTSLPNSNIFTLFPYLFRQKIPKEVLSNGFQDFLQKVVDMNLKQFLNCNLTSILGPTSVKSEKVHTNQPSKWWYLN